MEDLNVLVAYCSVHGSTAGIARAIALTLRRAGIAVDVMPIADVYDVRRYDAVVVGSAVYGGHWREEAAGFLSDFAPEFSNRGLWLFQSGPLGRSAQYIIRALPSDIAHVADRLRVKGCATFGGKLGASTQGPLARLLSRAGLAHDYRDFGEIRMWAEEVGRSTALDVSVGLRCSRRRRSRSYAGVRVL